MKISPSIIAFVKISQLSSFSKAAEQMGVSRSYISKLIQALETHLGTTLFLRTTRSVELTELGEHFYKLYKDHVLEIEKITKQLKEASQVPKGSIRITLAGAYGEEVVAPLISKLLARHSSISTELIFSEKILNLKKEKIDLAIRVSPTEPKDGFAIKIGERKERVCASESYLRKHGTPQKPNDLKKFNCLSGSKSEWTFKKLDQTYKATINGNFKSSNGKSLCQAALTGLGIVKLPEVYVQKHINEKRLTPILEEYTNTPVPIWAVTPFQKDMPYIVRLAIQELRDKL